MELLRKLSGFGASTKDLKSVYKKCLWTVIKCVAQWAEPTEYRRPWKDSKDCTENNFKGKIQRLQKCLEHLRPWRIER